MTADLIRLWAERDAAKERWREFVEEADFYTTENDPVLAALVASPEERTAEQDELFRVYSERHSTLLEAVREAERKVRVASGHEKP